MSLFPAQEKLASVTHADDSNTTKISDYPATVDFTILMNIIRRSEDVIAVMGRDVGNYSANVNGTYDNADQIRKSDKVEWDGGIYVVTNTPKKSKLFNRYKLVLRREL